MKKHNENKIARINKCFSTFNANPDINIKNLVALVSELFDTRMTVYSRQGKDSIFFSEEISTPDNYKALKGSLLYEILNAQKANITEYQNLTNTPFKETDALIKNHNFEACIAVNVGAQKGYKGCLSLFYSEYPVLSEEEKSIMEIIASSINMEEERILAAKQRDFLQSKLMQNEKMAGIGTLARGVAHEFNNILQIIEGYAKLLKKNKKREDIDETLDIILTTASEAEKTVKNLLTFTMHDASSIEVHCLAELIDNVIALLEKQFKKHNISIKKEFSSSPLIKANGSEIQQVFLNIFTNARDSLIMTKGGELTISAAEKGDAVEIIFKDTGRGMDAESIQKAFEPFYTTKGALGEGSLPGTGLGLFVAYNIIRANKGSIDIKSQVNKGTRITIRLPVFKDSKNAPQAGARSRKENEPDTLIEPGPLKILVVDDESNIRKLLIRQLSKNNCIIKDTDSAASAVEMIKNEIYNIIFLDVLMKGMHGTDILDKIKLFSPYTKIILMTGSSKDDLKRRIKDADSYEILEKPFSMEQIKEKIKKTQGN
jgi:signal transduction histidine kinase